MKAEPKIWSVSDLEVDGSWCGSLFEFAALFAAPPLKIAISWNSGRRILYATSIQSGMTRYLHPRIIRVQRSSSPLEVHEDKARLHPCFFWPYDGLNRIASDKVLGKLFL